MSHPPTRAYVTIRGSRSNRQVHRDASPTSSPSAFPVSFPFAALVIGHPDGTSTHFELSYQPDAHLRDGSEGALVDLTMQGPVTIASLQNPRITLCRVLVPTGGHGEPVPSYPASGALDGAADLVQRIVAEIQQNFRTLGGSKKGEWQEGRPASFAAMVDVEQVVRFVLKRSLDLRAIEPVPAVSTASAAEAFEGRRS